MSDLDALFAELLERQANKRLPPVNEWHPERVGRIDMRIDSEGEWWHEGRVIRRQGLVNVFSTVLRLDSDGVYYLVTPAEKLSIEVADVPFIGIDVDRRAAGAAQEILVTTNVEDHVVLDRSHALEMRAEQPYVHVRDGLYARLSRAAFYRLVEFGVQEAGTWVIYSQGARFELGPS